NVIIYLRRFVGREIDSNIIQNVDVDSGLYPRLFCYPISLEKSCQHLLLNQLNATAVSQTFESSSFCGLFLCPCRVLFRPSIPQVHLI
ncbi:hypothetical protein ABKV19_008656, partial [Rosa sericea]